MVAVSNLVHSYLLELHDLPLIKMIVAGFLGTGSFLKGCSNGHTK